MTDDARPAPERAAPDGPEDDHPAWLAMKLGGAMALAYAVARLVGFEEPTWSVISAGFVAVEPPVDALRTARQRIVAMAIGVAIGVAAAYASGHLGIAGRAALMAVVGAAVAFVVNKASGLMFALVIAAVVAFAAPTAEETIPVEALRIAAMSLIGVLAAPLVVWAVEAARAARR
ncbi:FUSC family protein [Jannaschia sp. Os4]|uniref:aromatic acid exporter family protein n=1 Tax=Jannaschia sp. Os4 TaxID=2807617 RepID=UPI0019394905|nr:FUSC family protein [Jannaschia sp. Os4]MBM2574732.1 FUSC family protein [Jannaschia sp. Os4]